jgi:hypothetical protein
MEQAAIYAADLGCGRSTNFGGISKLRSMSFVLHTSMSRTGSRVVVALVLSSMA